MTSDMGAEAQFQQQPCEPRSGVHILNLEPPGIRASCPSSPLPAPADQKALEWRLHVQSIKSMPCL